MPTNLRSIRIVAHQNNILRYRRILGSTLTSLERDFVERRIAEEMSDLEELVRAGVQQENAIAQPNIGTLACAIQEAASSARKDIQTVLQRTAEF